MPGTVAFNSAIHKLNEKYVEDLGTFASSCFTRPSCVRVIEATPHTCCKKAKMKTTVLLCMYLASGLCFVPIHKSK